MFVVFSPKTNKQFWCFNVVEKAMDICKKDFDFATGAQEVGDLDNRDEVSTVWSASCCSAYMTLADAWTDLLCARTPVDDQWPVLLFYYIFNDLWLKDLLQILMD